VSSTHAIVAISADERAPPPRPTVAQSTAVSYAADRTYRRIVFTIALVAFPIVVVIATFSGCDIRKRSEKRACRGGAAEPCLALGRYYEAKTDGILGFAMSNGVTATTYYDLGCKHGSNVSCERLGHAVFHRYDSVKDSDVTEEDAVRALAKACVADASSGACTELGKLYGDYLSGTMVEDLASRFFLDACNKRGEAAGCYEFADFVTADHHGVAAHPELAKRYFAKACAGGYQAGCARAK
jgi:TPR repeat protein